jgi:hypothetical protein
LLDCLEMCKLQGTARMVVLPMQIQSRILAVASW